MDNNTGRSLFPMLTCSLGSLGMSHAGVDTPDVFTTALREYVMEHPRWLLQRRVLSCAPRGGIGRSISQVSTLEVSDRLCVASSG
jgi:hypothetical protein